MKFLSVHSLIATFLLLTGCNGLMSLVENLFPVSSESSETTIITTTGNEVIEAVYQNLEAANTEDLEGYMDTIHPDSPYFASTRTTMQNIFATYDLSYDITDIELLEQTDTEARVRFTLVTERITGPEFNDNIVNGVFNMRIDNGVWKIYDQTLDEVEYIND